MEEMYNSRYHMNNILSYFYFEKLFQVIKYFPQLNLNFEKEYINFPLSLVSRAIEWRKMS